MLELGITKNWLKQHYDRFIKHTETGEPLSFDSDQPKDPVYVTASDVETVYDVKSFIAQIVSTVAEDTVRTDSSAGRASE